MEPRADDLPERAVIAVPLRCRKCRYDLRGLQVRGRCPECGHAVWETVDRVIDPEAAGLPPLAHPVRIASALTAFCALQLIVMGVALLPTIEPTFESVIDAMRNVDRSVKLSPIQASAYIKIAAILGGVTTIASLLFWPLFRGRGGVGLWAELVSICSLGWTVLAGGLWFTRSAAGVEPAPIIDFILMLALVFASIGVYAGLGRLLALLGRYSRRYRMLDEASRQTTREMIVALCAMWMGLVLRHLGRSESEGTLVLIAGTILITIAGLLLIIGQIYLLANSVVIARSLLQPSLRVEDLVGDTPGSARPEAAEPGNGSASSEDAR